MESSRDRPTHASEAEALVEAFPVTVRVPVAWAEMDVFQHVNNAVYFRYFETARIEYLLRIGFADPEDNGGVGAILASTHCRFRLPLTFPDTVIVGARTTEIDDDRFTMEYAIASSKESAIAAEGGGVVVAFDYVNRRKALLPTAVRDAIRALGDG